MYESLQQMQEICETENKAFWELVMEEEANEKQNSHEEVFEMMRSMYRAMVQADENYEDRRSASQMTGGAGELMAKWNRDEKTLSGPFLGQVMERALKMAESNACMKRIGSASAMTAGALVFLRGGSLQQIYEATALALKGLLGLVCDPVAGLVEVPCVKRNVIGAVNAVSCSDMAMAEITSFIPVDQVIDAMDEIGRNMPCQYKETSQGGLAVTPAGKSVVL